MFGSYAYLAIVPSLIRSMASSMTNSGTRNHSRGTIGCPKRSLISMSRRAGLEDAVDQVFKLACG